MNTHNLLKIIFFITIQLNGFMAWAFAPATPTITATGGTSITCPGVPPIGTTCFETCAGGSITLEATASPTPDKFHWYYDGLKVGEGNTFNPTQEGTYTARAVEGVTEGADSNPIRIYIINPPTNVFISATSNSFCTAGSLLLTANATGTGITFKWYRDRLSNPTPIHTGISLSVSTAGKYTIEAVNGCATVNSAEFEIFEQNSAPTGLSISSEDGTNRLCSGGTLQLNATLSAGATGATYQWYLNSLANPLSSATSSSVTANSTGNYILKVENGCGSTTTSFAVSSQTIPSGVNISASPVEVCNGDLIILNINSATGLNFTKCEWYKDDVLWQTVQPYNNFTVATETGAYKAKIYNKCGGSSFSNTTSVTVIKPPTQASITFTEALSLGCAVTSVRLTANSDGSPTDRITYQWYKDGTTLVHTGNFYDATNIGKYTIKAIADKSCGEISSQAVEITQATSAPTAIKLIADPTTTCDGAILLKAEANGENLTYEWYKESTLMATTTQNSYTATQTGNYKVRAKNACGTTAFSTLIPLGIYNTGILPPNISLVNGLNSACEGGSVPLKANVSFATNITYRWFRNGKLITNANTDTYSATQSGSYVVEVADGQCSQLSVAQEVFINAVPTVLVRYVGNLEFCEGDSTIFYATSQDNALQYEWFILDRKVGTGNIYVAKESGAYTLTLKVKTSCGATRQYEFAMVVTPKSAPKLQRVGNRLEVLETTDFYQWRRNGVPIIGAINKNYIPTDSGAYSVVLTNKLGCVRVSEEIIFEGATAQANGKVQISPNPNAGTFQLTLKHETDATVWVYDYKGKIVYEKVFPKNENSTNQYTIVLENLSQGLYILKVASDGVVNAKKIIIQ